MSDRSTSKTQRLTYVKACGIDWDSRRVYILGTITEESVHALIPGIFMLDDAKGPIGVYVSTDGGDTDAGMALYDVLRGCKNPVTTFGYGGVYSTGAVILQAGNKRIMAANALMMIHNATLSLGGTRIMKINHLNLVCLASNKRYQALLSSRSGSPMSKVARWCNNETYFSATEALKAGFIDAILED
jgi:ATP-dependent Clp endopeptidase proteolytic subunit ClpP